MKIIIVGLLISLSFISSSFAACNKKVTGKDVILFIDVNGGTKEIEEASKAACDRGQLLVVYPEQTPEIYKMTADKSFYENKTKAMKCDKQPDAKGCAEIEKKKTEVMDTLRAKANTFSIDGLKSTLKKLNDEQGRNVESLVISGHSDGKTVFGVYGMVEREKIQSAFHELPDQGQSVTSLIMLACYSANPSTILSWKKNLPELKMIAGSDASAAASDRGAGLKYLRDLLLKMKQLTADADEKKLNERLKVLIPTLKEVNSAIYIDSNKCGETLGDKRFFYSKSSGGLNVFNPEACQKAIEEYEKKEEEIKGYMTGETPIPLETHGTPLREAYSFLRQNTHCLEAGKAKYTADMLYGLLFYHQVKINAIRAFKQEADELNDLIKDFGSNNIWPMTEENIKNKSRKEILENIDAIWAIIPNLKGFASKNMIPNIEKLEWSLKAMTCLSPEWHEIQDTPSAPLCTPPTLGTGFANAFRPESILNYGATMGGFGGALRGTQDVNEEEE